MAPVTPQPEPQPQAETLTEKVYNVLDTHGPLRTATIARLLDLAASEVGALCRGMYAEGQIAMAEVYSSPENSRPSHKVWAVSINDFDVDPFDADVE